MKDHFFFKDIFLTRHRRIESDLNICSLYLFMLFPLIRICMTVYGIPEGSNRPLIGSFLNICIAQNVISLIVWLCILHFSIKEYNQHYSYFPIKHFAEVRFISKMAEIILFSYIHMFFWTLSYTELIHLAIKNRILPKNLGNRILAVVLVLLIIVSILFKVFTEIENYETSRN